MENFVNDLVLEKIDEIVAAIKDSKEYQDYHFLKEKMSHNQNIIKKVEEIKIKQKELVRKKYNFEDTKELEEELTNLENQLKMIPLYCDFLEKQIELNNIYQNIKKQLDNYLYNLLN